MIIYNNLYNVEGYECNSLAGAEEKARSLLCNGYKQVIIEKNKKPHEAVVSRNGEITIYKLKEVSYE